MIRESYRNANHHRSRTGFPALAALLAIFIAAPRLRGDEPYARSRNYHFQHSKIALRLDPDQKKVLGEVTHSLSILRDGSTKIAFDSVGLNIQSVTLNKASAKFETSADKLIIPLPPAAKTGEKFDVAIRYEGKPAKGIYFILPDKDYPDRPKQIWTQGESEDTRYYLPTYDYPNNRLTTETILTVPASWITVSNGKLISVSDAGKGLKTWYWKESVPSSTYLITVVAGEFDEVKDTWRGIPDTYYAPKGRRHRPPQQQQPPPSSQARTRIFHRPRRLNLLRARSPVVRRSRHLQGLGRHLAQRGLRHVPGRGMDRSALRQGSSGLRALE